MTERFPKYQHIENISDSVEIRGLLDGTVYVFPKMDGANHCVWFDERPRYGSRNRELTDDSTGFLAFAEAHPKIAEFITANPHYVIYGEYLTPHTIRDYTDDAWGKWYIFDIWDTRTGCWMEYVDTFWVVENIINDPDIRIIPTIIVLENPSAKDLLELTDATTFMMKDGCVGEGIVVKNYGYRNPYGRQTWGKIVRDSFKAKAKAPNKGERVPTLEESIIADTMTHAFVAKEYHKMTTDAGRTWEDTMTRDFLLTVWEEWWKDYSFAVVANQKTVDIKALKKCAVSTAQRTLNTVRLEAVDSKRDAPAEPEIVTEEIECPKCGGTFRFTHEVGSDFGMGRCENCDRRDWE